MQKQPPGFARPLLGALTLSLTLAVGADISSSTNYQIRWDVFDAGGGRSMSSNYTLDDTVGVLAAGISSSAGYTLSPGFHAAPDDDADGVRSFLDNCIFEANASQYDSNADGFGNICDADLNDDGIVNAVDLGLLKLVFFTPGPDADFNGDGIVNAIDLGILKSRFFTVPGPSGIAN